MNCRAFRCGGDPHPFHVPLFFTGSGPLQSTVNALTPDFFHELRGGICSHLEIETYTFDVLPRDVHPGDVVKSVAREYAVDDGTPALNRRSGGASSPTPPA